MRRSQTRFPPIVYDRWQGSGAMIKVAERQIRGPKAGEHGCEKASAACVAGDGPHACSSAHGYLMSRPHPPKAKSMERM